MTEDKKTVHLIVWLAFACGVLAIAVNIYGMHLLATMSTTTEPAIIQGQINTVTTAILGLGGAFLALMARTRSDSLPVTVENTAENPVPTEAQLPTEPTDEKKDELQ